jgi:hypothetical protein
MNSTRPVMIGVILITLGVTLTATSYFNVNYWQTETLFPNQVAILNATSSWGESGYTHIIVKEAILKKIEVEIKPSYELMDFLNSTMLSTYHLDLNGLNAIRVGLFGLGSDQSIIAYLQTSKSIGPGAWLGLRPVHVFDIPDDWQYVYNITVTNPENYPVMWTVQITEYRLSVDNNWQTAMNYGIASLAVGAVITGISVLVITPTPKKEHIEQKSAEGTKR